MTFLAASLDSTAYGRALIGDSLGFHILFAAIGVGLPLLICLAELIGRRRGDQDWLATARTWSHILVVLFVAGAISGTLISLQFGAIWPKFMAIAGNVMGPAFFLEGIGFFIEAVFLSLYVITWSRTDWRWLHWWLSLPIVVGSALSAFFITTANAFMNSPQGFSYRGGAVSDVHPLAAMFNHATLTETSHSISSYYLATAALFAGWYALRLWRRRDRRDRRVLTALMGVTLIFAGMVGATGDSSAKYLARYEPVKLAAAESLYRTQAHAPLQVGGVVTGHGLAHALSVPGLLSWLAYGSTAATVRGLDIVSPALWPPLVVHYCFDGMVAIGVAITLIPLLYLLLRRYRPRWAEHRLSLVLVALTGPLAFIAIELGWMLTELGRQPYVIHGLLTTRQAITSSPAALHAAVAFPILYVALLAVTITVLYRLHFFRVPYDKESL